MTVGSEDSNLGWILYLHGTFAAYAEAEEDLPLSTVIYFRQLLEPTIAAFHAQQVEEMKP